LGGGASFAAYFVGASAIRLIDSVLEAGSGGHGGDGAVGGAGGAGGGGGAPGLADLCGRSGRGGARGGDGGDGGDGAGGAGGDSVALVDPAAGVSLEGSTATNMSFSAPGEGGDGAVGPCDILVPMSCHAAADGPDGVATAQTP
jgi:hypothetical protein